MLQNRYKRVPLDQIKVDRDKRHRQVIETEDLEESIRTRGVMSPIIIDEDLNLIAGERRLTASRNLGLPDIPCRFIGECDPIERQIIELEENLKRRQLTWQEEARAVEMIHNLYLKLDPTWTQQKTAAVLGFSPKSMGRDVGKSLQVAAEMKKNPELAKAQSARQAANVIMRRENRRAVDAINELFDAVPTKNEAPTVQASEESIENLDFLTWASTYEGPKFNFLHCDFPYGVNIHNSDQANSELHGTYEDSEKTYWTLCKALCDNLDRLLLPSAHVMFWFSMEFYHETLSFFLRHAPSLEFSKFPLMWLKSDNKGILPDPKRGPRRIYETCLTASRDDRLVVKSKSNAYAAPTSKEFHQSEKPEPMLRHFMEMFVDENTLMLDPTCGSGSSLRAAESLGAKRVFGLEINSEFCEGARSALKRFRVLRAATGDKNGKESKTKIA